MKALFVKQEYCFKLMLLLLLLYIFVLIYLFSWNQDLKKLEERRCRKKISILGVEGNPRNQVGTENPIHMQGPGGIQTGSTWVKGREVTTKLTWFSLSLTITLQINTNYNYMITAVQQLDDLMDIKKMWQTLFFITNTGIATNICYEK